jgi:hypothetical protein
VGVDPHLPFATVYLIAQVQDYDNWRR